MGTSAHKHHIRDQCMFSSAVVEKRSRRLRPSSPFTWTCYKVNQIWFYQLHRERVDIFENLWRISHVLRGYGDNVEGISHRKRIYTEEKTKFVTVSGGTELLQSLAWTSWRIGCKSAYFFLHLVLVQMANAARTWRNAVPQEAVTTFAFSSV